MSENLQNSTIYVIPRGGFGNILFSWLFGKAMSRKYGTKIAFLHGSYRGNRFEPNEYNFFNSVKYCTLDTSFPTYAITETGFSWDAKYEEDIINRLYQNINAKKPINIILDGYFQSYKYGTTIIDDIKKELSESFYNQHPIISHHKENNKEKSFIVSVHVRRGDYLKLSNYHTNLSDDYYLTAFETIKELYDKNLYDKNLCDQKICDHKLCSNDNIIKSNPLLLIFTDDVEFAHNWIVISKASLDFFRFSCHIVVKEDFTYPNDNATDQSFTEQSFMLMSQCDHFIIANSSFSLLAYYFGKNDDSIIIAPKQWFGKDGPKFSMGDLIPFDQKNKYLL